MTVGFTFTEAAAVKPPSQVTRTVNTTPLDKPETGEWLHARAYLYILVEKMHINIYIDFYSLQNVSFSSCNWYEVTSNLYFGVFQLEVILWECKYDI